MPPARDPSPPRPRHPDPRARRPAPHRRAEPRRGSHPSRPAARRRSDCQKSLLTPRFDALRRRNRGGPCAQEEGEEYANSTCSDHHGSKAGKEEAHAEPALLVQPLSGTEAEGEDATTTTSSTVPLCNVNSEGPCARDTGGMRGHCMGNRSECKGHAFHPGRGVPKGSLCYGVAALTTLAGPELSVPRWIGYAIFGVCGG